MPEDRMELLRGTLDLLVLQTLETMGAMHGYGIARRIEQVSGHAVLLNEGTVYAALVRLQQRRWIAAKWGTSDNNRRAKFYSLTPSGRRALADQASLWARWSEVIGRVLRPADEGSAS
jgi:transcriptional regulator